MAIEIQKIIGSLVSQITESRAQSDFTSAQIAKLYAKDELLSKFPIARFRTPEIEITIPVIIDAIEEENSELSIKELFEQVERIYFHGNGVKSSFNLDFSNKNRNGLAQLIDIVSERLAVLFA